MSNTLVIARRKGGRVRMFDTTTAKMGPWQPAPMRRTIRIGGRQAGKQAAMQAEARAYWRETDAQLRVGRLTVPELRRNLTTCGIPFTTRMRKAELVAALLGTELA